MEIDFFFVESMGVGVGVGGAISTSTNIRTWCTIHGCDKQSNTWHGAKIIQKLKLYKSHKLFWASLLELQTILGFYFRNAKIRLRYFVEENEI